MTHDNLPNSADTLNLPVIVSLTRPQAGYLSYALHEAIESIKLNGDEYRKDEVVKSLSSFIDKLDDKIDGAWLLVNQIDDLINSYYGDNQ
jgi:hypothetical protein